VRRHLTRGLLYTSKQSRDVGLDTVTDYTLRSTTLIIQNRDGSLAHEPPPRRPLRKERPGYRAEVPATLLDEQSSLIEQIINFAFDTLGALRLEVRVREAE
jgi:hypothetical protein